MPGLGGETLAAAGIAVCPACGSGDFMQVGGVGTAFDSAAGGKVFSQPAYAIRYCTACGLYFKSHTLAPDVLDDYYGRLEWETFDLDVDFPTDRHLRRMLESLPNGGKVLDFGCSTGRILRHHCSRLDCYGVEVSEAAAGVARSRGIQIVTESQLRADEFCDFDAVLLTDVYEHLSHPVELVAMLAGLLRPGGVLAIVTGSADAIATRDTIAEFWYFRMPGHVLMVSERHLQWLSTRLELPIDAVFRCSHYATSIAARLRQHLQSFSYHHFRRAPRGFVTVAMRLIPRINRAEDWPNAPALTCTDDHVVAMFRKSSP